jgi:Transposase DDE domain/Transposase domain (DUF772)
MAIIIQQKLFSWKDVDLSGELERLKMVIETIPDEELMRDLEEERNGKRNDYPIRAVWNSILAGIVYQHASIESLRRELMRNGELREVCGFDSALVDEAVPSKDAYSSMMKKLIKRQDKIDRMFDKVIEELKKELPEFGKHLAIDSKRVDTYAKGKKNPEESSDSEAGWGNKSYKGKREDGSLWQKVVSWFGYKLHLVVDTTYELPVGYKVTKANASDMDEMLPMVSDVRGKYFKNAIETISADRGYDSEENNVNLYDKYGIKAVIDIRNMWKDKEETKLLDGEKSDNIVYNYKGNIFCHCPMTNERKEMAFSGFEKDRNTLKYKCPKSAYGVSCKGFKECLKGNNSRIVRIPLGKDRRVFVPIARSSYKWQKIYDGRTAVERVNSRIALSFGFDHHFVRGKAKMTLKAGLAMVVMLTMALARIKMNQAEDMRSLIKQAA